jgi:hypothetical protein
VSKITIRKASEADVAFVEENLRPADFEEYVMGNGVHPRMRFRQSAMMSEELYVGLVDGLPACVYGVTSGGNPWMMGTAAIEGRTAARLLVKHGRKEFSRWASKYGQLRNHVYAKNALHIRYIKALGCEVHPPQPHGALGAPFREFTFNV